VLFSTDQDGVLEAEICADEDHSFLVEFQAAVAGTGAKEGYYFANTAYGGPIGRGL
jgi:hypothetical protein